MTAFLRTKGPARERRGRCCHVHLFPCAPGHQAVTSQESTSSCWSAQDVGGQAGSGGSDAERGAQWRKPSRPRGGAPAVTGHTVSRRCPRFLEHSDACQVVERRAAPRRHLAWGEERRSSGGTPPKRPLGWQTRVCACTCARVHACAYMFMCVHTCVCLCARVCMCMHLHVCTCACVCACMCMCVR